MKIVNIHVTGKHDILRNSTSKKIGMQKKMQKKFNVTTQDSRIGNFWIKYLQ